MSANPSYEEKLLAFPLLRVTFTLLKSSALRAFLMELSKSYLALVPPCHPSWGLNTPNLEMSLHPTGAQFS